MKLFLNPSIETQLEHLGKNLPQALGLAGPYGVGLGTIARELAGNDLVEYVQPTDSSEEVDALTGSIKVKTIREIYEKTRGKSISRQIVIIDDADKMTIGAQNVFLKLLEEPHANLYFILTTHDLEKLLPTIRSRLQVLTIPRLNPNQNDVMLQEFGLESQKTKVLFIADGLPAELARLANDTEYFDKREKQFRKAREFLSSTLYQKIIQINSLRDKTSALEFCDTLLTILKRAHDTKPDIVITRQIDHILAAEELIQANGSVRLQLLRAMV